MILKGLLAPFYLFAEFLREPKRRKKDVKGDTEGNPQLSDSFLVSCQCFFPETINPN